MAVVLLLSLVPMIKTILNIRIMRESPLEAGKRRQRKDVTRKGARIVIVTGTRIGIGTEKRIVIMNTTETVIGIVVGNAVREGIGEEIGMMMMIITSVEIMTEEGTMIETGRIGIGGGTDPTQGVYLSADQSQDLDLVPTHAQRAKGLVVLTWPLQLRQC